MAAKERWVNLARAVELLEVDKQAIHRWAKEGKIQARRSPTGTGWWEVNPDSVSEDVIAEYRRRSAQRENANLSQMARSGSGGDGCVEHLKRITFLEGEVKELLAMVQKKDEILAVLIAKAS